ncbi:hypothetical protein PCE1_002490 [Barthelona sp. PCE]
MNSRKTLFVANFEDFEELEPFFSEFGPLTSIYHPRKQSNFCFVSFRFAKDCAQVFENRSVVPWSIQYAKQTNERKVTLFVGNLVPDTTEEQLFKKFSNPFIANIIKVTVVEPKDSRRNNTWFGFVEFDTRGHSTETLVSTIISTHGNTLLNGRKVRVQLINKKKKGEAEGISPKIHNPKPEPKEELPAPTIATNDNSLGFFDLNGLNHINTAEPIVGQDLLRPVNNFSFQTSTSAAELSTNIFSNNQSSSFSIPFYPSST